MDEWYQEDEIDWLTGEYTYKRERLRNILKGEGAFDQKGN